MRKHLFMYIYPLYGYVYYIDRFVEKKYKKCRFNAAKLRAHYIRNNFHRRFTF